MAFEIQAKIADPEQSTIVLTRAAPKHTLVSIHFHFTPAPNATHAANVAAAKAAAKKILQEALADL